MTLGPRLLLAASALFIVTFSVRASFAVEGAEGVAEGQVQTPTSHRPAVPPNTSSADYLGSRACARCHQTDFEQWERSLHLRMTKPVAEATVVGDFSDGTRLADHGRSFVFSRSSGRPTMTVTYGKGPTETFQVDYTLGAKRYQGYLSKLADGRIYVLPAFWHIESKRWLDWKEITPIPDGAHDLRQIWNTNCFNCHATNLAQGFDVSTRRYETTWTEMGIGCEACHGPGRPHVELMDEWEKNPASKPAYDNSAKNRDLSGLLKIFSPRSASPRQTYDTCAYCHGNKQNVFLGFRGGDRYEDYALPFLISAPIPANDFQGEFWPDGRPNRFNRPQALTISGCFKAGAAVCTSCHVAHGSRNPFSLKLNITQGRNGDLLCTQCHGSLKPSLMQGGTLVPPGKVVEDGTLVPPAKVAEGGTLVPPAAQTVGPRADAAVPLRDADIEAHTFHKAASAGSRCISCHMSDVNWRLLIRRRDHTFQAPVPEMTAAMGVPNACTTCHDNRSPEWAARQMDQWWGNAERRKAAVALADTMYRAGSGDATVLPALARLAIDRSQGVLIRASAVEFMQQLARGTAGSSGADAQSQTSFGDTAVAATKRPPNKPVVLSPPQINALIGAASDPEPMVRAHAVVALLATGDRDRIVTPILARLIDPARVVRARAAEALLTLGIAQLPGSAGEALTRAQDEYAAALSDFPDSASNHAELGWLELQRDRVPQAAAALDRAIRLDPRAARPWVIKGVMAARQRQFAAAIDSWRKAKGLDPGYPNIDQLIAEAEKQKPRN
jgi:predicted CXXCH cytochrome family protein